MKKFIFASVFALLLFGGSALSAQNNPDGFIGLPGDNLNLFAVMNLFQESETLEAFEKSLNDSEVMINNLDLNGDNFVDYIMVHDYVEGNIHNIVLRVALNRNEFQDVAVFTVEKFRNGSVLVQLIGDEALYGPNYVIEPNYAERSNPGYRGNVVQQQTPAANNVTVVRTTYYDVASWPVIVYVSRPSYRPWRSVWYWGYTPAYWHPWNPHYYHFYYGYHSQWTPHYVTYYRTWHHPRSVNYKTVYYTRIRNYSPTVVVNINKGSYKNTYSHPEKRREGEVLYSQRQSVGSRLPANNGNVKSSETVSRSAAPAAAVSNPRVARSNDSSNSPAVNTPRSAVSTRQNTDVSRDRNQTAAPTPSRNRVAAPQSNETKATPAASQPSRPQAAPGRTVNPASQPSRPQAAPAAQAREQAAAPTRTVNPASQPSRPQAAPAAQAREQAAAPGRTVNPASQPSRPQAAPAAQAREKAAAPTRTVQQPAVQNNNSRPTENRSARSAAKSRPQKD